MSTLSPNMGLLISSVGTDSGLLWEQNLNASELILDQHNHTPGSGVQIPPSGLNINSSLSFNNQQATNLQATAYTSQASLTTLRAIYFIGVDAYINDGSGNVIRLTSGGSVNATSSGIASGNATASFVSSVLVVDQSSNTPANIQAGSILIGNNTSGSNFATVQVPSALASNYNFVLPPGYPGNTSFLQMDTSGNVTASVAVSQGITASNIAANTITAGQIAANTITASQIAANTITASQIANATITTTQISATALINPGQNDSFSAGSGNWYNSSSITTTSTTSTTGVSVTGTSITPYTGRPIFINFGGGTNASSIGVSAGATATFLIRRTNGLTANVAANYIITNNSSGIMSIPSSSLNYIDFGGVHFGQYDLFISVSSGGTAYVTNTFMQLVQV